MNKIVLTKQFKDSLMKGCPEDISNPFSNGKMRFDAMEISNMNDHIGGVKIEFFWHGRPTHWIRTLGTKLENDMTLHIIGISGEQVVELGIL